MLDLVLNELSLQSPAPNASVARLWMSTFIQTVRAIKKAQANRQATLRTHYEFYKAVLAPDYPIQRWLNDREVDREEQRFIKNLVTKSPFSQDILTTDVELIENNCGTCEFRYQGKIAIGLGVAFILNTIPISLTSKLCWNSSFLELEIVYLDKDSEKIDIVHASCKEHIQEHINWLKFRLTREVDNGEIIWQRKEDLFPDLQFCDSVEKQLQNIHSGHVMLMPIQKKLSDLQKYSESWVAGGFEKDKIAGQATPESEATLNQYSQIRTFTCPDGQRRVFSWHVRLTPNAWRIYFYPSSSRKIIIGYIGSHLPTVKYH